MTNTIGNARLRAARQGLGLRSQAALAEAVTEAARSIGLRISVTPRTVRRWESASPPWPHPEHAAALEALFHCPITDLGFVAPWQGNQPDTPKDLRANKSRQHGRRPLDRVGATLPVGVAADYAAITVAYRHLYWTLPAAELLPLVAGHAGLGASLLSTIDESGRKGLATALSEVSLLAGRLEFFDLQQPEAAQPHFVLALQAAYEANDSLLGAAVLAHMAFAPAFSGDRTRAEEARDRIRAAHAFARRASAPAAITAWLNAVEAEVETRFRNTREALRLIDQAETLMVHQQVDTQLPSWFDWFSLTRLQGFKGNTLVAAGRPHQAQAVLTQVLADLPDDAAKQRSVTLADLAAAAVADRDPGRACELLSEAIEGVSRQWYATAMDRIKAVRESLREYESLPAVRNLDAKLYDWHTTVNSFS
ncbi:helix-turn-helix domain-containing protein [Mycobacterium kyorinense]|uniref:helix-turn-helix domain-containing protein n=1 Tax=Mycobacterium kyorinense TaxID=487514 RepID=UPI0005EEBC4C|nr:helix-turn-helix transcriptional regulator [Mycobacterium kyorinense]